MEGTENALLSSVRPLTLKANLQSLHGPLSLQSRDVLCSTFSSAGLRKFCYPHYSLEPSTRCTLFRRYLNDIYLLSSQDRRYALKVYQSEWRPPVAILGEVDALRHLAAKGIDVVEPIARTDGKWITELPAPEGQRSAVLFHWVDGDAPKWSEPSHSARLGRALAQMHAATDDLPSNATRPQMTIHHLIGDSLARIRRVLKDTPALAQRCNAIVERCRVSLRRTNAQPEDWGFCHGDVYLDNARIQGDRLVMLDFDWCGFGWRIFDLATFRWASRIFNAESVAWQPFIDDYLRIRPSAAGSLQFLRLFMILRHLWHIAQSVRTAALNGEYLLTHEALDDLISRCEQLEADPDLY